MNMNEVKIGSLIPFGGYNWRVLDIRETSALIITAESIGDRAYGCSKNRTWQECSLREYLNGEFLQTFTAEEQARIIKTKTAVPQSTEQCNADYVTDKIFILNYEEAKKHFELYLGFSPSGGLYGKPAWWLRESVIDSHYVHAAIVGSENNVCTVEQGEVIRDDGLCCYVGVRPALRVKLCNGQENKSGG
jgi:hypothetical protein